MVDVVGHVGMALVRLSPSWCFIDRPKTAVTVITAGPAIGLLPDIDLYLSNYIDSIHHHGVVHTVLAVSVLAAILGPLLGRLLNRAVGGSEWFPPEAENEATTIGVIAVWVAGLSHLFADVLSAPDVVPPIEPLWPIYSGRLLSIDLLWYRSWWATWALVLVSAVLNGALWYWKGSSR